MNCRARGQCKLASLDVQVATFRRSEVSTLTKVSTQRLQHFDISENRAPHRADSNGKRASTVHCKHRCKANMGVNSKASVYEARSHCSSSSAIEYMMRCVGSPAAGSSLLPGRTVSATCTRMPHHCI